MFLNSLLEDVRNRLTYKENINIDTTNSLNYTRIIDALYRTAKADYSRENAFLIAAKKHNIVTLIKFKEKLKEVKQGEKLVIKRAKDILVAILNQTNSFTYMQERVVTEKDINNLVEQLKAV